MFGKAVYTAILSLLILGAFSFTTGIRTVQAQAVGPVYIEADGTIEPASAPISRVNSFTYVFSDDLVDSLTVKKSNIIVDGQGHTIRCPSSGDAFLNGIVLTEVANVTITGLDIENFWQGVYLNNTSNDVIASNNVTVGPNGSGIFLNANATKNSVRKNLIKGAGNGIGVYWSCGNNSIVQNDIAVSQEGIEVFSNDNDVTGNILTNSSFGIWLDISSNNHLSSNSMNGFAVTGDSVTHFIHDIDASNTVKGKPIYYWVNKHDTQVPVDAGYVALVKCARMTVQNLRITNEPSITLAGTTDSTITRNRCVSIYLLSSSGNRISENEIAGGTDDIALYGSDGNRLNSNTITAAGHTGIFLGGSSGNILDGNNITENELGILLSSSSSNRIHHNSFVNNSYDAEATESINYWDDGFPSGGNYWSNYAEINPNAKEIDDSGIWSKAFIIGRENKDRYPLVSQTSATEKPPEILTVAQLNLAFQLVILAMFVTGFLLKEFAFKFVLHGILMSVAVTLNALYILLIMGPSLIASLPLIAFQPLDKLSMVMLAQAILACTAEALGLWLLASKLSTPTEEHYSEKVPLMAKTFGVFIIAIAFGFLAYAFNTVPQLF